MVGLLLWVWAIHRLFARPHAPEAAFKPSHAARKDERPCLSEEWCQQIGQGRGVITCTCLIAPNTTFMTRTQSDDALAACVCVSSKGLWSRGTHLSSRGLQLIPRHVPTKHHPSRRLKVRNELTNLDIRVPDVKLNSIILIVLVTQRSTEGLGEERKV